MDGRERLQYRIVTLVHRDSSTLACLQDAEVSMNGFWAPVGREVLLVQVLVLSSVCCSAGGTWQRLEASISPRADGVHGFVQAPSNKHDVQVPHGAAAHPGPMV